MAGRDRTMSWEGDADEVFGALTAPVQPPHQAGAANPSSWEWVYVFKLLNENQKNNNICLEGLPTWPTPPRVFAFIVAHSFLLQSRSHQSLYRGGQGSF